MSLMSRGDALSVAGLGTRTAPASFATIATLTTTGVLPAPSMVDVPTDALWAQLLFVYTSAGGSTGGQVSYASVAKVGAKSYQIVTPSGGALISGPAATAAAQEVDWAMPEPLIRCAGLAQIGVSPYESGDSGHPGALVVSVVWFS